MDNGEIVWTEKEVSRLVNKNILLTAQYEQALADFQAKETERRLTQTNCDLMQNQLAELLERLNELKTENEHLKSQRGIDGEIVLPFHQKI